MANSLRTRLLCHVRAADERVLFDFNDRPLTAEHLYRRACELAAWMRSRGVEAGDRVAVFLDAGPELVITYVATQLVGAIYVPINTRYQSPEIAHIIKDSEPVLAVLDASSAAVTAARKDGAFARVRNLIAVGADGNDVIAHFDAACDAHSGAIEEPCEDLTDEDAALIVYTSGTTGRSRGAVISARAIISNIWNLTQAWGWSEADRLVLALPLFHVHGLGIGVHGTLLHGMCAVVHPRFDAAAVCDAVRRGGTIFMGVPTMYHRLIRRLDAHPEDAEALSGARLFTSGSAALPADDHRAFAEHTGHQILERYGMTETMLTLSNPLDGERRPGSVGFAVAGSDVRILADGAEAAIDEPGEIYVRGASLLTEYWRDPQATAAAFSDGWFRTGDIARRDADGYIHIVGRSSVDILKSGGFKISAREIEELLCTHADIAAAAVVGLPDADLGQRVACAVTTSAPLTLAHLQDWLVGRLSKHKWPQELVCVDELPRNALGKLQKHRVIELFTR